MADQKVSALATIPAVDRATDLLYIVDTSGGTSNKTTANQLLGITGAPVGDTDTQTLSAKTLTNPTINGATLSGTLSGTYTLGGTPTFPSSVVTLTGSQTLTNKVLTSPTINTATIVNPTLTVDTVNEFTSANGVTVDGLNIKDSKLNTNNSVVTANITDANITPSKWTNPYKFSVYRNSAFNVTSSFAKVQFDTELFDTNNNYDAATNYRYTVPVSGYFFFTWIVAVPITNTDAVAAIYKNGTILQWGNETTDAGAGGTAFLQVSANDYFEIFAVASGTLAAGVGGSPIKTFFSGFLVSQT